MVTQKCVVNPDTWKSCGPSVQEGGDLLDRSNEVPALEVLASP